MPTPAGPTQKSGTSGNFNGQPSSYYQTFAQQINSEFNGQDGAIQTLGGTGGYQTPASNEPRDNTPFDPRMFRAGPSGAGGSGAFTKGIAVTSGAMSTVGTNPVFTSYFQFNPTEVDIDYGFDDTVIGALNPQFLTPSNAANPQGLMLNQSISFTLLYDRTYEVWTGPGNAPADFGQYSGGPYTFGAQWDVWSIERLVGIYGQWNGSPPSGPPAASLCSVQFGTSNILNLQSGGNGGFAPAFTGWMTSLAVEYTRFDAGMVPTRCAISLTFEQVMSLQSFYTNTPSDNSPSSPSTSTTGSNG